VVPFFNAAYIPSLSGGLLFALHLLLGRRGWHCTGVIIILLAMIPFLNAV
jgi:hypothetical protein